MSEGKLILNRTRGKSLLPWALKRNPKIAKELKIKLVTKEDLNSKRLDSKSIKEVWFDEY